MKKINLILSAIVMILVIFILFVSWSLTQLSDVKIKEVKNLTFEASDGNMFREEKWYYPLKGMVVPMINNTIPIGIAGQTYELDFGRIPINSSARKIINLNSNNSAKVEFYTTGNITPYMVLPENFFISGEKKIEIIFNGTETGNFTGTLMIRNLIPRNLLAEKIMVLI